MLQLYKEYGKLHSQVSDVRLEDETTSPPVHKVSPLASNGYLRGYSFFFLFLLICTAFFHLLVVSQVHFVSTCVSIIVMLIVLDMQHTLLGFKHTFTSAVTVPLKAFSKNSK